MKYIDLSDRKLTLDYLLRQDEIISPSRWPGDEVIKRLTLHSSDVQPGDMYLAIPPLVDEDKGQRYLQEAIDRKASIIVKQHNVPLPTTPLNTLIVDVENARKVRAILAKRIFPGQPSVVTAVTGTNGKTSVVNFCAQLWNLLGYKSASLGTLGYYGSDLPKGFDVESLTTPDPFYLHMLLSDAKKAGITHLALEASSHGLDQYRLDGISFSSAGFTNLSHDHLDYHGNMNAYLDAKSRLFGELIEKGETAVLNADIHHYEVLRRMALERELQVISYGRQSEDLHLESLTLEGTQQIAHISYHKHTYKLRLNFIGKFQVLNALCAAGMVIGSGIDAEKVLPALEGLKPVSGRLELIGYTKEGGAIYVDYAHTPDALHESLLSLRPYVHGVLTLVFGCGGNRDQQKRPLMGKLANQFSDAQILTDDNPRDEDAQEIRKQIKVQCPNAFEIADRYEAITKGISMTGKQDAVLIAGKGHEQYQIIKGQKQPFDDREVVREILKDTGGQLAA